MRQVEKESWYGALNGHYEKMIIKNEGNLILNANRAN